MGFCEFEGCGHGWMPNGLPKDVDILKSLFSVPGQKIVSRRQDVVGGGL